MQRTELPEMFYGAKRTIFQNACTLRQNMTRAEALLWEKLNKSQLGVRFKAQHPIDIFIADFYCHKFQLVIEVDGGIHKSQQDYDEGRTAEMNRLDLKVLRFSNEMIVNDIDWVVDEIKKQLIDTTQTPKGA
jgi:very-short-patch-repair endonuclease